jgi:membrane fusion protein, multidrug efflux system
MPNYAPSWCTGFRGPVKVFFILVITVAMLAFAGCSKGDTASAASGGGGAPGKGGGRGRGGGGDVPVLIAKASQKNVPVEVQVIGNVEAYSTISVKAQVTGQLNEVAFHEGDFVKKGELLFTIDQRPLEAALNQSQANVAKDEAALGQAQANLARDRAQARYAEAQATRYQQLFDQKIISRDQAEQLRANADAVAQAVQADLATIESMKASIGASRAQVENAKVQLGYTKIYSPITGRTGNLTVKQGNVVTANNMEMMTINQVEPIYVTFAVPESQLTAIKTYMAQGKLPVRVKPQDDESSEEVGTLTFVDNTVDMTTGTIKLKGTFPNSDHKLWPGEFVRVILKLTTQRDAITVPNEAVQTGQAGSFVYVVKEDRSVESRPVKVGARVENDMVIDSGLEAGETVVTEGQLRLAPGSKVVVRDGRGGPGGGRGGRRGEGGGQGKGDGGGQGRGEGRGEGKSPQDRQKS